MYITHLPEARARNESVHGPAHLEPEEEAWIPDPVGSHSSFVTYRFELPRFLDWLD